VWTAKRLEREEPVSAADVFQLTDSWLLDACKASPGQFLPLDNAFVELRVRVEQATRQWTGKLHGGFEHELTQAWVTAAFSTSKLRECKQNAGEFICCAKEGDVEDRSSLEGSAQACGAPVVTFRSGEDPYCVVCGAASAVYHFGDQDVATEIHKLAPSSLKTEKGSRVFYLRDKINGDGDGDGIKGWHVKPEGDTFDPLTDGSQFPVVIQLVARAHGSSVRYTTHAVTKLGNWIFDANETHALPARDAAETRLSLDRCCGHGCNFDGIVRALRLVPGKQRRKMLWRHSQG